MCSQKKSVARTFIQRLGQMLKNNQFNRPSETTGCSAITNNGSHYIDAIIFHARVCLISIIWLGINMFGSYSAANGIWSVPTAPYNG